MLVIWCLHRCQLLEHGAPKWVRRSGEDAYRHRMVSNSPLIMKANATA